MQAVSFGAGRGAVVSRPVVPVIPCCGRKRLPEGPSGRSRLAPHAEYAGSSPSGHGKRTGFRRTPASFGRSGYFSISLAAFLAFAAPLPEPPGLLPFFPPVVLLPPVALPFAAFLTAPSTFLPIPAMLSTAPFVPRSRYSCSYLGGTNRQTRTRFRAAVRDVLDKPQGRSPRGRSRGHRDAWRGRPPRHDRLPVLAHAGPLLGRCGVGDGRGGEETHRSDVFDRGFAGSLILPLAWWARKPPVAEKIKGRWHEKTVVPAGVVRGDRAGTGALGAGPDG